MNLYLSLLSRQLMTTARFEALLAEQERTIARYRTAEKSKELAEYIALGKVVLTDAFLANKDKLLHTKYAATPECQKHKQLKALAKRAEVKRYLNNKDAEKAEQLSQNAIVQEYLKLQAEMQTEEFKQADAFWRNPRRWYDTPECKQDTRYAELNKDPEILFFLSKDPKRITELERFKQVFADDFKWHNLADSSWRAGFAYPSKDFQPHHSFVNELQAYNRGKNVETLNNTLYIRTRKEAVTAPAWDAKRGMVMHDFQYTSDVLQNADSMSLTSGVIMVKARCRGLLDHGIYLASKTSLPVVSVFEYNARRIYVGVQTEKGQFKQKVGGFQPIGFAVYTLVWNSRELVWYVNNMEIARTPNTLPNVPLHITMRTFAPKGKMASEGQLEVEWIKVFTDNQ